MVYNTSPETLLPPKCLSTVTIYREASSAVVFRDPFEGRIPFRQGFRSRLPTQNYLAFASHQCPSHPGKRLWSPCHPLSPSGNLASSEQCQVLRKGHLSCVGREVSRVHVSSMFLPLFPVRGGVGRVLPTRCGLVAPALAPVLALGSPGTGFGGKGKGQLQLRFVAAPIQA